MEFSQFIAQTKDSRRLQGQRYSYEAMMWMVFISIACGHESCRKMATFSYASVFTRYFSLKHGTPSYVTFHSFLSHINTFEMRQSFNQMMLKCLEFNEGDWISGDGQTLCSAVTDCHTDKQDYVSLVSLYCQKTGLSILLHEYMNKDKSESESKLVLELLLENLANKGLMITLDALHCQKKTLDDIVSHGNDFTVQVKGNTPKLFDSVKSTVSPNLNLIERLWKFMRKKVIDTHFYRTFEEFRQKILAFFEHIEQYKQELETLISWNFHIPKTQTTFY